MFCVNTYLLVVHIIVAAYIPSEEAVLFCYSFNSFVSRFKDEIMESD